MATQNVSEPAVAGGKVDLMILVVLGMTMMGLVFGFALALHLMNRGLL